MAAKGIFVFVSLCLLAFAFGKPQNQVIMLIKSHNYYNCCTEACRNCETGRQLEASPQIPKHKLIQIPDVTPSGKLITGQIA